MGIYDFSYASITPDDVRVLRHVEHCQRINAEIMTVLESTRRSTAEKTEEIRMIAARAFPPPFDLDYAIAARDGAKARHDTPVVKLWEQEINRLKLELTERNDQRRTTQNDGRSGHFHD